MSAPEWSAKLVRDLERASVAIARLDTKFTDSPVAGAWSRRASWTGYAAALRGQGIEIEEIDIFARESGVPVPGRAVGPTASQDPDGLSQWQRDLRNRRIRHWRDDDLFSTETPVDWRERPALLQALEVLARHARSDPSTAPWLGLPKLLQGIGLTKAPLPCLVVADKALRLAPRDAGPNTNRFLKLITEAAEIGLARLANLERQRSLSIQTTRAALRPGALRPLLARLLYQPLITPSIAAHRYGLTISGGGKLLTRTAADGLLVEVSGRQAWRVYVATDLAIAFGFAKRQAGRPPSPPLPESTLDPALAQFDAEMAALDAMLARLGVDASNED